MKNSLLTILLLVCLPPLIFAQNSKRALEHEDVASWKDINTVRLSNDGNWASYVLEPIEGDKTIYWYNIAQNKAYSYSRGENPAISADSRYLAFIIKPSQDSIRSWKLQDIPKKKWTKDSLAIVDLSNGEMTKLSNIETFRFAKEWSDFLAIHLRPDADKEGEKDKKEKNGDLLLYPLAKGKREQRFENVSDFQLSEKGGMVAFSTTGDVNAISVFSSNSQGVNTIWQDSMATEKLSVSTTGQLIAFLVEQPKAAKNSRALYFSSGLADAEIIADANASFLNEDWVISKDGSIRFSANEERLYFGTASPYPAEPEGIIEEEQPVVEIWHYKDPQIYPQQKINLRREKRKTYEAVYDIASKKLVQLATEEIPNVSIDPDSESDYVLGYNDDAYQVQITWEGGPSYKDVYLIDQNTGKAEQIAEAERAYAALSPGGQYVGWYNYPDSSYFIYNISEKTTSNLTKAIEVALYDELNDRPNHPRPYGTAGWAENDEYFLVYDRYDIWVFDPAQQEAPRKLTQGRDEKIIHRLVNYDREQRFVNMNEPLLIHFTNEVNCEEGYLYLDAKSGKKTILQSGKYRLSSRPTKAKGADQWIYTKEDYNTFPNLIASSNLKSGKVISDANPQQKNYYWGNIRHVRWTSYDGQELRGLLATPENFDPNKKYPMIVNFYERSSQGLYRHRPPGYGRSTISYSYYTSRGYIVFNPDVPYRVGYPGESAYNAVVSGVTHLIDEGFVDKENIALQGHSWGGYQIAYIITKTDMFKCVESGAPVVNMFSAYGGIRWGSGRSRMFQYEHTQSRIGGTIWEYPIRYLENSPLFFADKINTPTLILHNDNDGAVPWYQGIEFFMALRRLSKPAWMLNYNNEPHWPLKLPNRKDFQKRLQQFFDHYLMDAPMPVWMDEGIPAIKKELERGYEPAVDGGEDK